MLKSEIILLKFPSGMTPSTKNVFNFSINSDGKVVGENDYIEVIGDVVKNSSKNIMFKLFYLILCLLSKHGIGTINPQNKELIVQTVPSLCYLSQNLKSKKRKRENDENTVKKNSFTDVSTFENRKLIDMEITKEFGSKRRQLFRQNQEKTDFEGRVCDTNISDKKDVIDVIKENLGMKLLILICSCSRTY
jgi:hypothetical protein